MKIDLYSQTGEKKGQIDLNPNIFGVEINEGLIHQALVRQMANNRKPIAHAKVRSEVSGGGIKPYRQKGTGRARQGSIRSPLFRGGGAVFGPRNTRNFKKDMPKKQRRKALFATLSAKVKENQVIALEKYGNTEYKTKKIVELIDKLPIEKNVLIVTPEKNVYLEKSSNNIPYVKTLLVNYLNIADILKYEKILFLKESLKKLEEIFLKKKEIKVETEKSKVKSTRQALPIGKQESKVEKKETKKAKNTKKKKPSA